MQDTDVAAPVIPEQPEKLISLRLEIAGGLDLTIASPYRKGKSRRTPSVEGINIVAGRSDVLFTHFGIVARGSGAQPYRKF